ncbi:MAG: quinone oxidoreductase family protein [Hyphomicrobiales bacterium]
MRAVEVAQPGGVDNLAFVDVPDPVAGHGEVVIDVAYAAANWSDIQKREGVYPDPVTYPAIIGLEVSGTVCSFGDDVTGLAKGQRVAAITGPRMQGGYAEKCVVGADFAIALPEDISLEVGAAFPVVTLTAYHLINSAYDLKQGETALVHAIGGAVGLAVTQLAAAKGATVIGTVSSAGKGERARGYGAHLVIDRSAQDFCEEVREFTGGRGVDLVIDSLGADILPRSIDLLKTYGHVINIGEAAGYPDFDIRSKLYENSTFMAGFEVLHAMRVPGLWRRAIDEVLRHLQSGTLEMPVEDIFPFDAVHDLHRRLESRSVSGKLLLQVGR